MTGELGVNVLETAKGVIMYGLCQAQGPGPVTAGLGLTVAITRIQLKTLTAAPMEETLHVVSISPYL